MRTAPYIPLILTIAILIAVAPLCVATAVTCGSCVEMSCRADEHGVPGEFVKRPVLAASSATGCALAYPACSLCRTTMLRDIRREAPPAPAARLRV